MLKAKLRSFVAGLFHRPDVESGMSDEIRFHIEARAKDLIGEGEEPREAMRKARLEFGSIDKYKEEVRGARGLRLLDELICDIRYALRMLRKTPVFTFAAVATLALGIAANSLVFGLVNEVFLKKLPVAHADELIQFDWLQLQNSMTLRYSGSGTRDQTTGLPLMTSFSRVTFERFRSDSRTLADVFAFAPIRTVNVTADNHSDIADGQVVSGAYFRGLGVTASHGRLLMPNDDEPEAQPVAVISDKYWRDRFGGSNEAIGKTVLLNGVTFVIVGVTPPGFYGTRLGTAPAVMLPLAMRARVSPRGVAAESWEWWLEVMGRAKPGVSPAEVLADVQPLFAESVRDSFESRPALYRTPAFSRRNVIPQLRATDGSQGPIAFRKRLEDLLQLLMGVVGLILVVVAANVANLLMARASARKQELSVRLAIGAGRGRLIRQLLTESVVLASLGGILGVTLAYWGRNFHSWLPEGADELLAVELTMDWRVIAFTVGLSLVTGILFGVFPGLRATKRDLSQDMRMNPTRGGSGLVVGKSLLVMQVALCTVLLAGAGILIRSVWNLGSGDVGFDVRNIVLFDMDPSLSRYDRAYAGRLYERMIERLEAVPGVRSATLTGTRPISGGGWSMNLATESDPENRRENSAYIHNVPVNFFETMGIPIVAGRGLTATEVTNNLNVAVISETLSRRLFGDLDAVGKRFRYSEGGMQNHPGFQVVGVVRDSQYHRIDEPFPPIMYIPFPQGGPDATLLIRTASDAEALMPAIREAVREIDPNVPLIDMTTQLDQTRRTIATQRMFAVFTSVFGAFGVLMACIGLYGIVSYSASRRINEIGIRMALGAERRDVIRLVMHGTYLVTAIGVVAGLVISVFATPYVPEELLYRVPTYDPATVIAATALIAIVSAAAGYIPARRASKIDPLTALRYE